MPTLYLTGAGPGDAELITLKAIRAIRSAGAVLYDALIPEELLSYTRPDCRRTYVGKRKGCHAFPQQEINRMIVAYAYKYGTVVRLKGGDPFVFGRAYEEISAAREAGIHVEIIPGISSAIAVPESAAIPLTCRGTSESFWVMTGTTQSGDISSDIQFAAQSTATVVLLMAVSKLEKIMEIFAHHGKAETPAAIIQEGCTQHQKVIIGTVNDICFRAQAASVTNPAIVVVGEVISKRFLIEEVVHTVQLAGYPSADMHGGGI